jgi:predicted dehydrogenase
MPSDVMENLWDFITEDKQQFLSEQDYELYADDDEAWEKYVIDNFDMLWERYEDNFYNKIRLFIDAVKEGGSAPVPSSQIIYNQAIIDGISRSAKCGREVTVEIPEI